VPAIAENRFVFAANSLDPERFLLLSHSRYAAASAQQVNDKNNQRHNQQQVDKAPAYMETKAEKPQNS
jgi:hypothetical protein